MVNKMMLVINIEKAIRVGLIPKEIIVTRGGKTFPMKVYMRPITYSAKIAREQHPESKVEVITVVPSKGTLTKEGKPLQTEHYVQIQPQEEGKKTFFERQIKNGELIVSRKGVLVDSLHTKDKKIVAQFVKDEKGSGYDVTEVNKIKIRTSLEGALDIVHKHLKEKESIKNQMEQEFIDISVKRKRRN